MFGESKDHPVDKTDRKLGDEWVDWDGKPRESETDERMATFFILSGALMLLSVVLISSGWFLIKPRIEQLSPYVSDPVEWAVVGFTALFVIFATGESIELLKFGKPLFPYRQVERFFLSLLPKTIWLGEKLGISRDRVGNSFIKAHNLLVKVHMGTLDTDRILILLPRCLKKEVRNQIISRMSDNSFKVITAGGGEEARASIKEYRPAFILALACERDLMSGIKDVAKRIPVLAIPNKRPEGPCKNTHISLSELDDALRFIARRKNNPMTS